MKFHPIIKFFIMSIALFPGVSWASSLLQEAAKNVETRLNLPLPAENELSALHALIKYQTQEIKKALLPYSYFKPQITATPVWSARHLVYPPHCKADQDEQMHCRVNLYEPDFSRNIYKPIYEKKNYLTARQVYHINYQIKMGPSLLIHTLEVDVTGPGALEPALKKYLSKFPLRVGDPLISPQYETTKHEFLALAQRLGYQNAQLSTHQILINLKKYQAQVKLILNTGPRYYFGPIQFQKNPLYPSFLQRFANFKPGQPYDNTQLYKLQDNLSNSNYFQTVSVVPGPVQPDRSIPTIVHLKALNPRQYSIGLGYGSDTQLRGTLGTDWRYITPYGDHFSALLQASQVQNALLARYVIPGKNPLTDQYFLNASIQTNSPPVGTSRTYLTGAGYMTTQDDWQKTYSLNYAIEKYQFNNELPQISHLLLPGLNLQYLKSDNTVNPTKGHRFVFNVQASSQTLLSDTDLLQAKLQEKILQPLTEKSWLILRGDLGYTTIHDLTKLPLSMSFFAGGTQSVRGFTYQSIGPGRYLTVASVEYQHLIKGNFNGALFFDIGNAYNNFPSDHLLPMSTWGNFYHGMARSVGIGVVMRSPVGALELTLANAVSLPDHPWRVQFNMGPLL